MTPELDTGRTRTGPTRPLWPSTASTRRKYGRLPVRIAILVMTLLLLGLARHAHANCSAFDGSFPATVSFTPPATITLPANLSTGTQTIIWASAPVSPSPSNNRIWCSNYSTSSGLKNQQGGEPTDGTHTLFPTGIAHLYYKILHANSNTVLSEYPYFNIHYGVYTASVQSILQLVATGPIPTGSTLTGNLGYWQVDGLTQHLESFQTSAITFISPACKVAVDPTVVTLPTVSAATFNSVGSTAGQTAFQVQLTCPTAGVALDITLNTSNPATGATGVITSTGSAGDVGVQIVKADGSTPVSFGTAIPEGNTPNGTFNLPFYARYYQTGNHVTAGSVHATATYTLTYP